MKSQTEMEHPNIKYSTLSLTTALINNLGFFKENQQKNHSEVAFMYLFRSSHRVSLSRLP